jgi:SSS family solute:Na+ symporter
VITLAAADIAVIALFAAAVLAAGFSVRKADRSGAIGFLLAGRPLTLPLFVMTLVSTWYGGVLGVGEFTYRYGISNWVMQGLPYYLFAALFAWFLAPRIRATSLISIPDKLEAEYGRGTALLGSVLTLILMTPAPYLLMLGVLMEMLFGWGLVPGIVVAAAASVSYLFTGGFRADVRTDVVEFCFMFAGFGVILPWCVAGYGGLDFLRANLPPLHFTWHGGNGVQYILVWFFIALWTFVDPSFHQRCYAARDERTARNGILVSIAFWFCFDLMTVTTGLYARAILPDLPDPVMAYPLLAERILPPVAKGMFFAGILATIMSTLNTYAFVSGQTLGRDIFLRFTGPLYGRRSAAAPGGVPPAGGADEGDDRQAFWTRIGLVGALALSIPMAALIPSVIGIWYTVGTVTIPGLIVPVLCAYSGRWSLSPRQAFIAMAGGWIASTGWWIGGLAAGGGATLFGIEPIYPGLAVSVLAALPGITRRARSRTPSGGAA